MTDEQRLDRLERIAKLFVRAGLRERRTRRGLEEKIDIIVDYQLANEERFAKNEDRFSRLTDVVNQLAQVQTRSEQRIDSLAEAQMRTEARLESFIAAVERDRHGSSN
ncbi:MAG TPA: hypothetical protein VE863_09995 [Pyrinomonadaceae bacterium]|jgi:hypothetical protein|nr:hypothetical protein [Pyrinomonadaceae bacterium]